MKRPHKENSINLIYLNKIYNQVYTFEVEKRWVHAKRMSSPVLRPGWVLGTVDWRNPAVESAAVDNGKAAVLLHL